MLPYPHLSDHPAAAVTLSPPSSSAAAWRAALCAGSPLPPMMVLSKTTSKLNLTAKPSLLAAHAANALPSTPAAAHGFRLLVGYVTSLSLPDGGVGVGFLGDLKGVCPPSELSDTPGVSPAGLLRLGQTVLALPREGGGEGELSLSLKPSACAEAASLAKVDRFSFCLSSQTVHTSMTRRLFRLPPSHPPTLSSLTPSLLPPIPSPASRTPRPHSLPMDPTFLRIATGSRRVPAFPSVKLLPLRAHPPRHHPRPLLLPSAPPLQPPHWQHARAGCCQAEEERLPHALRTHRSWLHCRVCAGATSRRPSLHRRLADGEGAGCKPPPPLHRSIRISTRVCEWARRVCT